MTSEAFRPLNALDPETGYPYSAQFEACKRLLHTIKHDILEGRWELPSPVDQVVHLDTCKAINLYEAILHLALDGFGLPAEMLLRPMFESVVTSWWATTHVYDTDRRFPLHRQYLTILWARARKNSGLYNDIGAPDPLSPQDLAQAESWFGRFGQRGWTGETFQDMAEQYVRASERPTAIQLNRYLTLVHRYVNWMMHSTGLNYLRLMTFEEGVPTSVVGPSPVGVLDAMDMSWNLAVLAIGQFAEHFSIELGNGFSKLIYDVWAAFKGPDLLHGIGRNDPCPCRAGMKFKTCHGSLLL